MQQLANEMSSCWSEFGEGKINYASGGVFANKACAVCSIVNFDNSLKGASISYQEFYTYLQTAKKDSSQTYLQYLYSTGTPSTLSNFVIPNYLSGNINTSNEYFILTGISKSVVWGWFGNNQIPVVILEKTSDNYNAVGCDEFLTKS